LPQSQHISSKDFAAKVKSQYPQYAAIPDEQLVHAVIQRYPQYSTIIDFALPDATIKAAPTFGSLDWIKQKLWQGADITTENLPAIGGGAGAMAASPAAALVPGAGALTMIGGAGLGGMAGRGLKSATRKALFGETESIPDLEQGMTEEGLSQAGLEAVSAGLARPIQSVAKKMRLPENVDVMRTNKEFGLNMTYPEQVPGPISEELQRTSETSPLTRYTAQKGRERTLRAAESGLKSESEQALGKQPPANIAGTQVQRNATKISRDQGTRGNIQIFKDRVGSLKSQVNAHLMKQVADPSEIAALKAEAQDELAQIERLKTRPARDPSEPLATAEATGTRKKLLTDILRLKDTPNLTDLIELRSKWMGITPEITEPLSKEGPAAAKHYVERMTGVIDKSIIGTQAQTSWNAFRNFTRKGSEIFESQRVVDLLNTDPEKIVRSVGPQDITGALQVRRAITQYAQQYGSGSEKRLAQQSWNKFRAMWFDEHVIKGPMDQLPQRLKNVNPAVLQHVIATDPEGKVLVQNTLRLSRAMDRLAAMAPRNMHALLSFTRGAIGAGTYPVAKMLYNPKWTARLMKATEWLAAHPNLSPANAERALQLIFQEPTAKRNQTEEPVAQ
jgi:hypothetical protein